MLLSPPFVLLPLDRLKPSCSSDRDYLIPYKVEDFLECLMDSSFFDILDQFSVYDWSLSPIWFYFAEFVEGDLIEMGRPDAGNYWSLGECSIIGKGMVSC